MGCDTTGHLRLIRPAAMITTTGPCHKPGNEYSNKRWCCGDDRHLDLSWKAFEKIGRVDKGVVGVKFRKVPCPTGPKGNAAPAISRLPWLALAIAAGLAAVL